MRSDDLPLSRSGVDRDGLGRVREGLIARLLDLPSTRVLHLIGGDVLTGSDDALMLTAPLGTGGADAPDAPDCAGGPDGAGGPATPEGATPVPTAGVGTEDVLLYLGRDTEHAYLAQVHPEATGVSDWAEEISRRTDDPQGAPGARRSHLREVGWQLPAREAGLATEAVALANWHSTHRYCPRCGGPTEVGEAGWVRRCSVDGSQHFPRTDPAVIMAITDDEDRLLLAHGAAWPPTRFSVPAGFVEPGESLEAAVRREVGEETGVLVGEVTYQASQPWPFPASLMVGMSGRARTTEVTPDGVEVTEAMFLTRAELARAVTDGDVVLPRATSIAHHLIAQWYGGPLPT
ncbi:NAD(+) diphosphatase [Pseudactinotalea sp. Z1748]|uniref:NAD(+) diphosphatase n=1 Tax=Pseudactinotalea sp. Z1748 TaxID=3413027 RepID=UPI003C7ECD9E